MANIENQKTSFVSIAVFVFALVVILLSLTSLFFPSLLVSLADDTGLLGDPFEPGPMIMPILFVSIILLIIGILYYSNRLPNVIRRTIHFIFNFEISHTVAVFAVVGLMFFYIGLVMTESVGDEAEQFGDFERVEKVVDAWPYGSTGIPTLEILHVKNFLLKTSLVVFQNIKIVPFLASISLLLMTYFFTVVIAKKRFAGIVAMVIVLQSYVFLSFGTSATYSNFWTLFYLLSLYLLYKKWYISAVSFLASAFSKPLTFSYLPISLFFTWRAKMPQKRKIYITISYAVLVVSGIIGILVLEIDLGGSVTTGGLTFDIAEFLSGLSIWSYQLRLDTLFLLFILPVSVGLFLKSRQGIIESDSVLVLISVTILAMPLLAAMTTFNLHPYRMVPLEIFFAIGVGMLFSKKITLSE